jgi:integrase/recombinase XerD
MKKYNEQNERTKRDYYRYLKEARKQSDASIDVIAAAINRFEAYSSCKDFKSFHREQAIAFKHKLAAQLNQTTGKPLSKSTVRATLAALRAFFIWLAGQPGFRSRFRYSDADYFNPLERDVQIALSPRARPIPPIEQIRHALNFMPATNVLARRDRALIAFILLTGCRDRAAVSVKLKHIDLTQRVVYQDPREVETKRGKTMTTFFFPVGDVIERIVTDWISELREEHLWGVDDPLFPSTEIIRSESGGFQPSGLKRVPWSNADAARRIFKKAFETAGLPYFHPHSFRKTLARLGQEICRTPEELKAWSQNLGHTHMLTTLTSYGHIDEHRQGEIIREILSAKPDMDALHDLLNKALNLAKR